MLHAASAGGFSSAGDNRSGSRRGSRALGLVLGEILRAFKCGCSSEGDAEFHRGGRPSRIERRLTARDPIAFLDRAPSRDPLAHACILFCTGGKPCRELARFLIDSPRGPPASGPCARHLSIWKTG